MNKFTEIYFDDALHLAQFLSKRFNQEIKPVEERKPWLLVIMLLPSSGKGLTLMKT